MEHTKNRIEILLGVVRNLLDDIVDLTVLYWSERPDGTRKSVTSQIMRTSRYDLEYIRKRTLSEGISFLTVQLPRLGKWYDQWISEQQMEPLIGFKPWYVDEDQLSERFPDGKVSYPLFCSSFARILLDEGGSDSRKAEVIRLYRSLFYLFYKLEQPLSDEAQKAALINWRVNEEELANFSYPSYFDEDVSRARDIISDLLSHDSRIFTKIEESRHGPGAVAGGENGDEKWSTFHYIPSLHRVYPLFKNIGLAPLVPISLDLFVGISEFLRTSRCIEPTSRLLFVPKDSRGPRTISCEPKELMYFQQGVKANLMKILPYTSKGRINFLDQSINGNLALTSSEFRDFATIDLKDASDRVSLDLVKLVFPDWTHKYLEALRSTSTLLPDGSVVTHRKYAPMGSALCFPVESMIFWAFSVVASYRAGMTLESAKTDTYVFGDDIIIRPQAFEPLVRIFSKIGLKVNVGKSFVSGPFRESCGVDAWKGFNVTPFKIKKDLSRPSLDGPLATAMCKYSSRCFALNYRKTGEYILQLVERRYPGIPRVPEPIGCLHVIDPLAFKYRFTGRKGHDKRMCTLWISGWQVVTAKRPTSIDGLSRFLKHQTGDWRKHDPGKVVVPRSTKIRKRRILVEGTAAIYLR